MAGPVAPRVVDWFDSDGKPTVAFQRYLERIEDVGGLNSVTEALKVETWSWFVEYAENKDYHVIKNLPYGGTVNSVTTDCTAGTCTVTGYVDGVALSGTANSASTTEQTQEHTSAVAVGADFKFTVSSNSSCEGLTVTVKFTRS